MSRPNNTKIYFAGPSTVKKSECILKFIGVSSLLAKKNNIQFWGASTKHLPPPVLTYQIL